jgi:hypothetical protein
MWCAKPDERFGESLGVVSGEFVSGRGTSIHFGVNAFYNMMFLDSAGIHSEIDRLRS